MKIPVIGIIAIVIIAIDRKIPRSFTLPRFALGLTRGLLQVRMIYLKHTRRFHSILMIIAIGIIAIAVIAIIIHNYEQFPFSVVPFGHLNFRRAPKFSAT